MPPFRRPTGARSVPPNTLGHMPAIHYGDHTACAIKITREAQIRLCEAAGIGPPKWEDRSWPEHELRAQTLSLTQHDLDEILFEEDVVSRRPYLCTSCGGNFTVDEYVDIQMWAEVNHKVNPFEADTAIHGACGNYSSDIDSALESLFQDPS